MHYALPYELFEEQERQQQYKKGPLQSLTSLAIEQIHLTKQHKVEQLTYSTFLFPG